MARKYLLAAMAAGFLLVRQAPGLAQSGPGAQSGTDAPTAETPPSAAPPAPASPAPTSSSPASSIPGPSIPVPPAAPPPGAVQPGAVQPLPKSEASGIVGRNVRGADGRDIGRIIDVIVDQGGQPRAVVVDFGGFLGVGSRKIAVDWAMLHFSPGDPAVPITLGLTPDQIKTAPEYREDAEKPPSVVGQPAAAAQPAPAVAPSQTPDATAHPTANP